MSVAQAFVQEQPKLLALPENPFPCDEQLAVSVGKTPYIRFDLNDYSVPHIYAQKTLQVRASLTSVRILDGAKQVAHHRRSYDKGEQVEEESHIKALLQSKHQARCHRGQDRLAHVAPSSRSLLEQSAQRGHPLKRTVSSLLELLSDYGAGELEQAIQEALQQQVPHPNAVRQVLERRREQRRQPPPVAVSLPDNAKNIVVRPASLTQYDQLNSKDTPADDEESS